MFSRSAFRTSSAVLAVLLVLLGFSFPGSVAAITLTGPYQELAAETVDFQATGSIKVSLPAPNPYDDRKIPFGGVEGTRFTAERLVAVDLTTSAGWDQAASLSAQAARFDRTELVAAGFTDSNGEVVLGNLPVGAYLVTADTPSVPGYWYQDPQPMVITVPMAEKTTAGATWVYQLSVQAKPHNLVWVNPCQQAAGRQVVSLNEIQADFTPQSCQESPTPTATPSSPTMTSSASTGKTKDNWLVALPQLPGVTKTAATATSSDAKSTTTVTGTTTTDPARKLIPGSLAATGVNIVITLVLALTLTTIGVLLITWRRREAIPEGGEN